MVCVDLDATVAADLPWESFVDLLKRHPWRALGTLCGLWRGAAWVKRRVADGVELDPSALPFRPDVVHQLTELRLRGTVLVLVTAADQAHASAIADHLGLFSDVIASDGRTHMSGRRKTATLESRYGRDGFEYFDLDSADARVAHPRVTAAPGPVLPGPGRPASTRNATGRPPRLVALARALRPHQWVKNLLVCVPVIAGHKILRVDVWAATALTFVVFSLCASAVYIINDILDVESDRRHPRKRARPFAAGDLRIPLGLSVAAGLLISAALITAAALPPQVAAIVVVYLVATTLYSLVLKRHPVVDVFALTGLYVLRIVAGGVATATPLSSWLLAFTLFFFLSLAFVKRYAEVVATEGWLAGRGYGPQDALWMQSVGTSSGYMAVLVLALYVTAADVTVMYSRPQVLGMLCPVLLLWITRLWFRAGRKQVHDDPVVEAIRDRATYAVGAAIVAVFALAI